MAELQGGKRGKLTQYREYDHVWSQFDDNVNNTECMKNNPRFGGFAQF